MSSARAAAPKVRGIGIDVGGTSVKGGVVDLAIPEVVRELRERTPVPAVVGEVVDVVARMVRDLELTAGGDRGDRLPLGVALSGDVRDGVHTSGVNLDPSWVGAPVLHMLEAATGRRARIINDGDAAGLAEVQHGAALGVTGVVVVLTFGTGIGSGVFLDGRLLPNTGLGQFPFRGSDAELSLSAVARERRGMEWGGWAAELNEFLAHVDAVLRPDLVVIGGGISGSWDDFSGLLAPPCPVRRAHFGSLAGVIGAADFAAHGSD